MWKYDMTACLHPAVMRMCAFKSLQKYFSQDAWCAVTHVVEMSNAVWYCGSCTKSIYDDTKDSIMCDSCP